MVTLIRVEGVRDLWSVFEEVKKTDLKQVICTVTVHESSVKEKGANGGRLCSGSCEDFTATYSYDCVSSSL